MVKTFEEYINEGLWKSGIERSRTGIVRKEDELDIPNNVKDLNEIDFCPELPFVFADKDLELNGEKKIPAGNFGEIEEKINKMGWRLPTIDEILEMDKVWGNVSKQILNSITVVAYRNKQTKQYVSFSFVNEYLCFNSHGGLRYSSYDAGTLNSHSKRRWGAALNNSVRLVRLVKDKK